MKKILLIVLTGLFFLPILCDYCIPVTAKVKKDYGVPNGNKDTNIHKSDSVSVDYDMLTGTIVVSTDAESKAVGVRIYKEGTLIYMDNDNVRKGQALNYVMTDEESGEYDICVDVENGDCIEETIVKE